MICEPTLRLLFWPLNLRRLLALRLRCPLPDPLRTSRTDDSLLAQYYMLATGTILFYDYLLTLADEVCRYFPSTISRFFAEATLHLRLNMSGLRRNLLVRPPPKAESRPLLIFRQHFGFSLWCVPPPFVGCSPV